MNLTSILKEIVKEHKELFSKYYINEISDSIKNKIKDKYSNFSNN